MELTPEQIAHLGAAFESGFSLTVSIALVGICLSEILGLIKR